MNKPPKTFPASRARRGLFLVSVIAIVFIVLARWQGYQDARLHLLNQKYSRLQDEATQIARSIADKRDLILSAMINLAEQRSTREGVDKLVRSPENNSWESGFLQGLDASCRSMISSYHEMKSLTLRTLLGVRLAGLGKETEPVGFPKVMERVHIEQETVSGKVREKWIVPVRDVEASPLAYLVAEIELLESARHFLSLITEEDERALCIVDGSGKKIWVAGETYRTHDPMPDANAIITDGNKFSQASAKIPDTNWQLYIAGSRTGTPDQLKSMRANVYLSILSAAVVLLVGTYIIGRKFIT